LLRVLFLWIGALSANPERAGRFAFLLSGLVMANDTVQRSRDWLSSPQTGALAWWLPKAIIVAGLLISLPARAVVWVVALVWMGTACILNARRCGRTHCRFTGPYYLAMIFPVLVLASGVISVGLFGWIALAVLIIGGSLMIWWITEQVWGTFS
jgi:hypothetical protein